MSKLCSICNSLLTTKAIKPTCAKCRHREVAKNWVSRNKQQFNEHQKKYREENRALCNARSRISYWKKPEEYNKKTKEWYRKTYNIPLDSPNKKKKNGEGYLRPEGYKVITVKGHPNAYDGHGKIHEHTYIMSQYLNRPLNLGESVHHKNGMRDDNRIENLELWSKAQPPGQRIEDKIKWAIEFLGQYGYKLIKE
jgi:hypothetical protein